MVRSLHTSQRLQMTKFQIYVKKLSKIAFFLFSLFLPFQIDYLIYQSPLVATSSGVHFFSSSFIHISELFLVCGIVGLLLSKTRSKGLPLFLLISCAALSGALLLTTFFAIDPYLHIIQSRYILYGILLLWTLCSSTSAKKYILYGLILAATLQAVIVVLQSITGQSIGLHLLGEPLFSPYILTSAKANIQDLVLARPYGTMNHPNIVAAFMLLSLGLSSTFPKLTAKYITKQRLLFIQILLVTAILLTLSKAIIAIILLGIIVSNWNKKGAVRWILLLILLCISLLLLSVFDINSLIERVQYFKDSIVMIARYPLGVGLGSYTSVLPAISSTLLQPWEIQPVHSLLFLFANETGIFGALSLLSLIYFTWRYTRHRDSFLCISALVLLSFVDHYFLTSYPLSTLWWISLGFVWSELKQYHY